MTSLEGFIEKNRTALIHIAIKTINDPNVRRMLRDGAQKAARSIIRGLF